jgi:hypothetical protein
MMKVGIENMLKEKVLVGIFLQDWGTSEQLQLV